MYYAHTHTCLNYIFGRMRHACVKQLLSPDKHILGTDADGHSTLTVAHAIPGSSWELVITADADNDTLSLSHKVLSASRFLQ